MFLGFEIIEKMDIREGDKLIVEVTENSPGARFCSECGSKL